MVQLRKDADGGSRHVRDRNDRGGDRVSQEKRNRGRLKRTGSAGEPQVKQRYLKNRTALDAKHGEYCVHWKGGKKVSENTAGELRKAGRLRLA